MSKFCYSTHEHEKYMKKEFTCDECGGNGYVPLCANEECLLAGYCICDGVGMGEREQKCPKCLGKGVIHEL